MALQASGQISASNIANEFGYTNGSETRLGSYRSTNGQGNFPVSFGTLSFSSIDGGGSVPTSGQIKFSDFYNTRLQQVVNFYGSGRGGNRLIAKDRYNSGGSSDVNVVGNYRTRPNNSSGTKVHIHVNQTIGCEQTRVEHCALRTGSWDSSTTLQVDIGGSGRISGAGGNGGAGRSSSGNGSPGGDGTSALGIQYNPTQVNVASGGFLVGGFAGGGGGAGGFDYDKRSSRHASGGGGGGGAGIPAGAGGPRGTTGALGGNGSAGNTTTGGEGGGGSNNGNEAFGGGGGDGGQLGNPADNGGGGSGGEGSTSSGGSAGTPGAAIRRNSGFTVNVSNNGNLSGSQTATTVL
jgi:hypothetical protein|tara:strand:+ start:642 stop:1688 length:1047 start_codon:yes stop_codon:yes gene_type:complete